MVDESKSKCVLQALRNSGSLAFLEISTICNIGEQDLREIINTLENKNFVRVSNREDILNEIITLRTSAMAASGSYCI